MEPRIQYAKTADGVSIAFATTGEGPPLVFVTQPLVSHVQLEWRQPVLRALYGGIATSRMLVRLDVRGTGLSEREVDDLSIDACVRDLEAVVDRLELSSFALVGTEAGGLTAITYAVRHPERVSHLVLLNAYARDAETAATPQVQALLQLERSDWEMFAESIGALVFGYRREEGRQYGDLVSAAVRPGELSRRQAMMADFDLTDVLPQVSAPTLVLHHTAIKYVTMEMTRDLAARIPTARLHIIEGTYADNVDDLVRAIDEFLSEGEEPATAAETPPVGTVHTILFTDMESSTTLRRNMGDAKVQELVRTHNQIVRDALKTSVGSEIKHTGDGIMASFSSATSALQCAIAIQRGVASHVEQQPDSPFGVYIGLNAGEPIAEEQDLFGTSVDLARRICDHAEPGQILASNVVRELSEGKGFLFGDIGDVVPKGFEQPVRLYEVRWREDG
jgi:class 3 adenylate cyclase